LNSASSTLLSEKTTAHTTSNQTITSNLKYDSQPRVSQQSNDSENLAKAGRSNIVTNLGDKDFGMGQNANKKKANVPPLSEKEENFELPGRKVGIWLRRRWSYFVGKLPPLGGTHSPQNVHSNSGFEDELTDEKEKRTLEKAQVILFSK
jgi:hypothetical protein